MIRFDTNSFILELIKFAKFQDEIPNGEIEDYFNFTKDEYVGAQVVKLKSNLAECFCIWRQYRKFELRDAEDPYEAIKKNNFTEYYNAMKQKIADDEGDLEISNMLKANFSYVVRSARDKMKIGLMLEMFMNEELKILETNPEHVVMDVVSEGVRYKDFLQIINKENPTLALRSWLLDADSRGAITQAQTEKKKKVEWHESLEKLEELCQKMLYATNHKLITLSHAGDIILLPMGVIFEPRLLNKDKEEHKEAEVVGEVEESSFYRDFTNATEAAHSGNDVPK